VHASIAALVAMLRSDLGFNADINGLEHLRIANKIE
jgi:hypothetical protein